MSSSPSEDELVVYLPDADLTHEKVAQALAAKPHCTTINLGKPGNELVLEKLTSLPKLSDKVLALRVWNAPNLTKLPELPEKIELLDVRGCTGLIKVDLSHATNLLLLDCGGCANLKEIPTAEVLPLEKLFLDDCPNLPASELLEFLMPGACKELGEFDFSRNPNLEAIGCLPPKLFRARLRDCPNFRAFGDPDEPWTWPQGLKTLDLRGSRAFSRLPGNFPAGFNYLDLRDCSALKRFPQPAHGSIPEDYLRGLWTLFLHGSGVRNPPRVCHGGPEENAAAATRRYFQSCRQFKEVVSRRAKILVLGNGSAGKTKLSMCLRYRFKADPEFNPANPTISTHGVQFFNRDFRVQVPGGLMHDLDVHFWDFGGQDLYHNTHRAFVGAGTLFLLVWNPDESAPPPGVEAGGHMYEDVHHPLAYWVDFIREARPDARILLVCTRCGAGRDGKRELEARWKGQLRAGQEAGLMAYYVDSMEADGKGGVGGGQIAELEKEVSRQLAGLLEEDSGTIPLNWRTAEEIAEDWLRQNTEAQRKSGLDPEANPAEGCLGGRSAIPFKAVEYGEFHAAFSSRWRDGHGLAADWCFPEGEVDDALGYLSRIGLVFWRQEFPEKRIIVGQQWALDGIYALLRRPAKNDADSLFAKLRGKNGRFQPSELGEWIWNQAGYTKGEQALLLGLMEACGLCFKMVDERQSYWNRDVYVSLTHVRTFLEEGLLSRFADRHGQAHPTRARLCSRWLHPGVWRDLLIACAQREGAQAWVACDGLLLQFEGVDQLLLTYRQEPEPGDKSAWFPLAGALELEWFGPRGASVAAEIRRRLQTRCREVVFEGQWLLNDEEARIEGRTIEPVARKIPRVYVSYSHADGAHPGIEEPLSALKKVFGPLEVEWVIDVTGAQVNFLTFMEEFKTHGEHFLVIHSPKYWKSPYCLWEMDQILDNLTGRDDAGLYSHVIPLGVGYPVHGITAELEAAKQRWAGQVGIPLLPGRSVRDEEVMRANFISVLDRLPHRLAGGKAPGRPDLPWDLAWDVHHLADLAGEIKRRLAITPRVRP